MRYALKGLGAFPRHRLRQRPDKLGFTEAKGVASGKLRRPEATDLSSAGWQAKALSVLCEAGRSMVLFATRLGKPLAAKALAQSGRSAAAAKIAKEQGALCREAGRPRLSCLRCPEFTVAAGSDGFESKSGVPAVSGSSPVE